MHQNDSKEALLYYLILKIRNYSVRDASHEESSQWGCLYTEPSVVANIEFGYSGNTITRNPRTVERMNTQRMGLTK